MHASQERSASPYLCDSRAFNQRKTRSLKSGLYIRGMRAIGRARNITKRLACTQSKSLAYTASTMKLDINSTLRMKSGYGIPVLGYGR